MRKYILFILLIYSCSVNAQPGKDSLLIKNGSELVEEMSLMWNYDQAIREYTQYQTFNKHITDSIELLDIEKQKQLVDSLRLSKANTDKVWNIYITPADNLHTKRMIEIIKTYGFPSAKRIRELTNLKLDFQPYILLMHSPSNYWEDLKLLVELERKEGNINKCEYGYLLWHLNGRKDMKYFLENGYVLEEQPDGKKKMTAKNCE